MSKFQAEPVNDSELKGRFTFPLFVSILAAGLGSSFIFGYNLGVINSAANTIQRWIAESLSYLPQVAANSTGSIKYSDDEFMSKLTRHEKSSITFIWGFVVGLFPVGAIIGGFMTGFVADTFGRKGAMMLNNIFTFAGGLTMFFSKSTGHYGVLIFGRFLIGINCGLNTGLAPMYLTEISPVNYRGLLGSVCQLIATIAILISSLLGFEFLLGNGSYWPYLLGFTMVPSIYQLLTLPFCPESPKYLLITKGRVDEARDALIKLRQSKNVDAEMSVMQAEAEKLRDLPKVTLMQLIQNPVTKRALIIASMMMLSQQFSGINAVMFYSTSIFTNDAKLTPTAATVATFIVMMVNVLMTVVSTVVVDKAGRRTLHMGGLAGMFVSSLLLVLCLDLSTRGHQWAAYGSILFVILFVISFATGPGSIPWFYVSECFEQGARGSANSVAVGINWLATAVVGFSFPFFQEAINQFSCLIFTACLAIFFIFTWKFVPETKGKTIEQVIAEFRRSTGKK